MAGAHAAEHAGELLHRHEVAEETAQPDGVEAGVDVAALAQPSSERAPSSSS